MHSLPRRYLEWVVVRNFPAGLSNQKNRNIKEEKVWSCKGFLRDRKENHPQYQTWDTSKVHWRCKRPSSGSCSQPPRPPSPHRSNQGPGTKMINMAVGWNRHASSILHLRVVPPKPACISLVVVTIREACGYILEKSPSDSLISTCIRFGSIQFELLPWNKKLFWRWDLPTSFSSAHFLCRLIHLAFGLIGLSWEHAAICYYILYLNLNKSLVSLVVRQVTYQHCFCVLHREHPCHASLSSEYWASINQALAAIIGLGF